MDFMKDKLNGEWNSDELTFDVPIVGETHITTIIYLLMMIKVFIIMIIVSCRASKRNKKLRIVSKWA
ncbi:P6 [Chelidonium yellow mottle associated virus]|nr:TPA_asm: P6 [Chelidonium alphacytorhabdovirus 1]